MSLCTVSHYSFRAANIITMILDVALGYLILTPATAIKKITPNHIIRNNFLMNALMHRLTANEDGDGHTDYVWRHREVSILPRSRTFKKEYGFGKGRTVREKGEFAI